MRISVLLLGEQQLGPGQLPGTGNASSRRGANEVGILWISERSKKKLALEGSEDVPQSSQEGIAGRKERIGLWEQG